MACPLFLACPLGRAMYVRCQFIRRRLCCFEITLPESSFPQAPRTGHSKEIEMKRRFAIETIAALLLMVGLPRLVMAEELPRRTPLDDYIQKPDDSYAWKIASTKNADGMKTIVVDLVSQHWRTKKDVDRTEWRHWLTVSIPQQATSDIGMLLIGGGYNGEGPR